MAKDTTGRLHVQVKTGGKRKLSSKLWLERQLNDPYVAKAKAAGYRSRAAFKQLEIDDKFRLLKSGMAVVDLGAAPGGWSQIAAKRVGSVDGKGKVVAIDLLEMPEIPGVDFAQLDFMDNDAPDKLTAMLGGGAEVDHGHAGLQEAELVVDLQELERGARAIARGLRLGDIGIVELPLQPEFRRQFALAGGLDLDVQATGGVFRHLTSS